jgi:hypothetical protein
VEISEDMFIVTKETAEEYEKSKAAADEAKLEPTKEKPPMNGEGQISTSPISEDEASAGQTAGVTEAPTGTAIAKLRWTGEIPNQKWMNFYTKVLAKFASEKRLKLTLNVEVFPEGGISTQKIEETKQALRELGLNDDVETS